MPDGWLRSFTYGKILNIIVVMVRFTICYYISIMKLIPTKNLFYFRSFQCNVLWMEAYVTKRRFYLELNVLIYKTKIRHKVILTFHAIIHFRMLQSWYGKNYENKYEIGFEASPAVMMKNTIS
jgi:hypothetical protein